MAYPRDLLETAKKLLAGGTSGGPSLSDCNRAVSTAYYAIFDFVCRSVADRIVEDAGSSAVNETLWISIYRSFDHKTLRDSLFKVAVGPIYPSAIPEYFASTFKRLQDARIKADYDVKSVLTAQEAEKLINEVDAAIFAVTEVEEWSSEWSNFITALIVETFIPKPKR